MIFELFGENKKIVSLQVKEIHFIGLKKDLKSYFNRVKAKKNTTDTFILSPQTAH